MMNAREADPETAGLKGQLVAQVILGGVFMAVSFDEVARGLVAWGVPGSRSHQAAFLFDFLCLFVLLCVYAVVGRRDGCLSFLVLAAASIGVWGTYLTVALEGGLELQP